MVPKRDRNRGHVSPCPIWQVLLSAAGDKGRRVGVEPPKLTDLDEELYEQVRELQHLPSPSLTFPDLP